MLLAKKSTATTIVRRVRFRSTMFVPPCEAGVKPIPPMPASRPLCMSTSDTRTNTSSTWTTARKLVTRKRVASCRTRAGWFWWPGVGGRGLRVPAVEQGADEAFCFSVCLRPVGSCAEVFDRKPAAGDRVDDAAVGAAVVGEDAFDGDAVALIEGDRAAEEGNSGGCFFVGEHLGVGEAAVVVDADVDALVADVVAADTVTVGEARVVALAALRLERALARPAFNPAEPLDVDVDELARSGALVADRLLEPEPAELAHPGPGQDPGHGRERHPQRFRDLRGGEAQPA